MTSTLELGHSPTDLNATHVPLGEIITGAKVVKAGSGEYPLLSMTMHHGLVRQEDKFKKRVASRDLSQYKVVSKGQLVVGFPIDEGVLSFQTLVDAGIVSPAYGVWDLRAPDEIDRNYLEKYLRSPQALSYYSAKLRGSTARRRSLPREVFLAMPIPVRPVREQRRVAAILDRADDLRNKRRQALVHLDALIESLFQAMVQDAGALLPAMTLAELGLTFSSGKNLISSDGDAHEHNRVIKVNAVSGGVFQPSESKPLPRSYVPNVQHRIRTGDLLFTRASGSIDLIGISARVGEVGAHLFLPDKIWRANFTPGTKVCPEYLQSLFKTAAFRAFVNNSASGAAGVKNISQRSVLGFVVSAPKPAAQEEFAKHVTAIELLKHRHRAQLAALEALFVSLQHRAFKGEL